MRLLTCKEATHLASRGLDRRLGVFERVSLRLHLAVCDGCTRAAKQFAFLRKAMKRLEQRDA